MLVGKRTLLQRAFEAGKFGLILRCSVKTLILWFTFLSDPHIRADYLDFNIPEFIDAVNHCRDTYNINAVHHDDIPSTFFDDYIEERHRSALRNLSQDIIKLAETIENEGDARKYNNVDMVNQDDVARVRQRTADVHDVYEPEDADRDGEDMSAGVHFPHVAITERDSSVLTSEGRSTQAIMNTMHRTVVDERIDVSESSKDLVNEFEDNRNLLSGMLTH